MNKFTMKLLVGAYSILCFAYVIANGMHNSKEVKCVVLGLGGRAHGLLNKCVEFGNTLDVGIRVVAVCDNHAQESLNFYIQSLRERCGTSALDVAIQHRHVSGLACADQYQTIFASTVFYPDTEDGLKALLATHSDIDYIIIASSNDRHFTHIDAALKWSTCKKIFIEKPVFRNLRELQAFTHDITQHDIVVGLTLRYSNMAKNVVEQLKKYKEVLGTLRKVVAWELVSFPHAWSIIMMNWRRYKSASGGLLVEKSVHDLDLALFFMQALDVYPREVTLTTQTDHKLFTLSNKDKIKQRFIHDVELQTRLNKWARIPWQRIIDFVRTQSGDIDWGATVDVFFKEFPADEALQNSDIIPDFHKITAHMLTTQNNCVDFELTTQLSESLAAKRGVCLTCANAQVAIDIERGVMNIDVSDGTKHTIDLNITTQPHAGGDQYIAYQLLGKFPEGQHKAAFTDPCVQLSILMGVVSERQALPDYRDMSAKLLEYNGKWIMH